MNGIKPTGYGKKILCIAISLLLLLSLAASVKKEAVAEIGVDTALPITALFTIQNKHLIDTSFDGQKGEVILHASSAEDTGSFALPEAYQHCNVLFLHTHENVYTTLTATYTQNSNPDKELTVMGTVLEDGRHMFVFTDALEGSIRFEIKAGAAVGISAVDGMQITGYSFQYAINWLALAVFAILVLILLLLEKKLGYLAWIMGGCKQILESAKQVKIEHGTLKFALHILSRALICAFAVMAWTDFAFDISAPAYSFAMLILATLAIAGVLADTCLIRNNAKPATLLLVAVLILGSTIVLTTPTAMQIAWDDGYHFANTSYSPMILTNGGKIPLSVFEYACEYHTVFSFADYPTEELGHILYFGDLNTQAINLSEMLSGLDSVAWYYYLIALLLSPLILLYLLFIYISYIPGIITILLTSLLGGDFIKLFLIGKLTNVLCYSLLVHFAVKKLKSGAYIFSAIAMLPIFIFLGAAYSADWWINGAFLLGTAYFLSILQTKDRPATRKELIIMITAFTFACGPKEIYFLLMLPLLLIPRNRFQNQRTARRTKIIIALLMLVIVLSFAVPMLFNSDTQTDVRGGSDVSASGQIAFILQNPFEYAKILISFIKNYVSLSTMSSHISMFAWLGMGNEIYSLIAILVLFFFVFTDRSELDRFNGAWKIRAFGLLVGFAQIVLAITSMYIAFTPVGHEWVNGCQYRYIFPVFPLMLYSLSPISIENKMSERAKCALLFGLMAFSTLAAYYDVYISTII